MNRFILLNFLITSQLLFSQSLVINEVMSENANTIFDEFGNAPDWIELYNYSDAEIDLQGYFLSDDTLDLRKWQFGDLSIGAFSHLLIFASDHDTFSTYPHTNFKISSSGEKIILSDTNGTIVDSVFIPASFQDISYGRINDGSIEWIFQIPSPGSANTGEEILNFANTVSFSLPAGFYSEPIEVELTAGESEIFYTLDGSDPNESSTEYIEPIAITNTTVLKAISLKDNFLPGPTIYHSYLINENTKLPVISLSTDPDNLFDPDSGIYENFEEDWEWPAHVQFFDDDKNLGFSENVGIHIYGGYTRRFVQKSLAVKFKSDYGKKELKYELFPGFEVKTFKSFILRNSGNDFDQTHIRDAFMQTLVKDLDIDYLEYRPTVTFINGEYWGIYNIREKISEHYIANRHGVDPDNIDMMEGYSAYNDDENDPDGEYGLWVGNLEAIHGDTINFKQLIDFLNTENLSTDGAYSFIDSMIDIDECLLYYAAQVYYNSQDWPANNSKYWRERSPEGKWRWILYDLDFGFNLYEWNNQGNSEDHVDYLFSGDPSQRSQSKPVESTFIPRKIVENPKIRNQFVNQVADLLNTKFKTDRVLNIMNAMADHIADDIGRHRAHFEINGDNINRMISFAQNRPGYLRDHVRNFFDSGDDCDVTINIEGKGKIKINSLTLIPENLSWSGVYFQDNAIYLSAVPEPGHKFDGWGGTITSGDDSLEVSGIGTMNLTALFSIDSSSTNEIVINEINYNSSNDFETGDWIELYNRSDDSINISGWYISDSDDSHKFNFPNGTILQSGEYLVVVEDDSSFTSRFPEVINYIGETGFGFSGSGELIRLYHEENQLVDSLTYDDALPWPIEAGGFGATLELVNMELDNSIAENWKASENHGTPGILNSVLVSIDDNIRESLVSDYALYQNYPNPFNPTTQIKYSIPNYSHVTLKVFNLLGEEVKTIFEGYRQPGKYSYLFNAEGLSSGMYLYSLKAGNYYKVNKFLLLK